MDQSLSKFIIIFSRHRWSALATFLAVMSGVLLYAAFAPRMYQSRVRMMLIDKPESSVTNLGSALAQQDSKSALANQEELALSKRLIERALQVYFQQWEEPADFPLSVGSVKKNLEVATVPGTQIMQLSFQSPYPELSARMANSVARTMIQDNAENIRAEARSAREFLESQIPQRRQQLEQIEESIQKFKQDYGYTAFAVGGQAGEANRLLVQSYAALEDEARTLSAQLKEVEARNRSLSTLTNTSGIEKTYQAVRSGQDPELQNLRAKLTDLDSQLAANRSEFTDSHPSVQAALQEREAAYQLYTQRLSKISGNGSVPSGDDVFADKVGQDLSIQLIQGEIERRSLRDRLSAVSGNIQQLEARRKQFPILEQTFIKMDRRRQALADSLRLLESKLDEARIAEAQLLGNFQIIDLAEIAKNPSSPNILVTLILGTIAGVNLAIGTVLLLEALNRKLYSANEVTELTDLPVLGVLPKLDKRDLNLPIKERITSNIPQAESYRSLLRALEFRSGASHATQLLVVSSSVAGEGKSSVVSSLGAISAMLSRKTLIIDADLRRPTQHQIFDLPSKPGLSDVFTDDLQLDDLVQETTIPSLSVITAGSFCLNPMCSVESEKIYQLLQMACDTYDLVIVDTPPVTSCVDAMAISNNIYPMLLVARPNVTEKPLLSQTVTELTSSGIKLLGVAVNGSVPQSDRYYHYKYRNYRSLQAT